MQLLRGIGLRGDPQPTRGALPDDYDPSALFGRAALDRARVPEAQWRGFTIATVLDLGRPDMKLLAGA